MQFKILQPELEIKAEICAYKINNIRPLKECSTCNGIPTKGCMCYTTESHI